MALPLGLATAADAIMRTGHGAASERADYVRSLSSGDFARPLLVASASVVMGAALLLTRSRSGVVAFAAGTVLVAVAVLRRQRTVRQRAVILIAFAVLVLGSAMWAGLDNAVGKFFERNPIPSAVGGRTGAWKDTVEIIRDFPLTGAGLNSYGSAMTLYQSDSREMHFQEAHNDYLQLAAEGGVLVGIPVLAAIGIFVRDVRRRFREAPKDGTTYWLRVGSVVGLIAIALQSLVEFSLQMPGNAAMFALLAAVALHRSPNLRLSHADQRSGR
jgi:O-antigen ligase